MMLTFLFVFLAIFLCETVVMRARLFHFPVAWSLVVGHVV